MNELSVKLKQLRNEKGLSQVGLAKLAGVNHSTISLLENGKRKFDQLDTLSRISGALDITLIQLLQSIEQNIENNE